MPVSEYLLKTGVALLFLDFTATVFSSRFTADDAVGFGFAAGGLLLFGALARAIESDV